MTSTAVFTPPATTLVTGANGFVGQAVVADLRARGGTCVHGVTRADYGAMNEGTDWSPLLAGVDCIVHAAARAHVLRETTTNPLTAFRAANTAATLGLARAAERAGVRRLIFISSIGVNGTATHGRAFTATDTPSPTSPYAISKYEAEIGLIKIASESGLEVVIIRPPLVLGANPKGNLASLVSAMRRGIPLPFGWVSGNKRDLVSLPTLTDLITRCINHPGAIAAPLLVSDGFSRSTREIIVDLARMNEMRPRLVPFSPTLLNLGLNALGKSSLASQLLGDLELDLSVTKTLLSWSPPS